jgi:hypothetical protein
MTADPPSAAAVRRTATRIVIMLNEVEAGVRPPRQVTPLFALHLRGALTRLHGSRRPVAELRRLVITARDLRTWELLAVCRREGRVTVTSLRLRRTPDGWLVTDLAHPRVRPDAAPHMSDPATRAGFGARARR